MRNTMAHMATRVSDAGAGETKPQLPGSGKLQTRDYITIGVYTVLYFVLISVAAGVTHVIPVGMPLTGFACGLFGGIPYMMVAAKSHRFGAITIMGILLAVLMGAMHGNYYTIATAVAASVGADLIAWAGRYRSLNVNIISAGVFNLWSIGMFLPFYIGRNDYLGALTAKNGAQYSAGLAGLFPGWVLPALPVLGVLGGVLGAWFAKLVIRKHFEKAGLV